MCLETQTNLDKEEEVPIYTQQQVKILPKEKIHGLRGGRSKEGSYSCFKTMKTMETLQRLPNPRDHQREECFREVRVSKQFKKRQTVLVPPLQAAQEELQVLLVGLAYLETSGETCRNPPSLGLAHG